MWTQNHGQVFFLNKPGSKRKSRIRKMPFSLVLNTNMNIYAAFFLCRLGVARAPKCPRVRINDAAIQVW